MLEWLERKLKSAYLNLLESEVKRLREENRQLMNSILAAHGMGQIEGPRTAQAMQPIKRRNWIDFARRKERESTLPPNGVQTEKPHA
jgi:hypothetical protein